MGDDADRKWTPLKPVGWFLGLELVNGLRGMALDALQHDFNLRDWMNAGDPVTAFKHRESLWFDYIADLGDGALAMQSLAYHLQRPIELAAVDAARTDTSFVSKGELANHTGIPAKLDRGAFLFIGGDCAYPASDMGTLRSRVYGPFRSTHPDPSTIDTMPMEERVPLYGIPGNHDYYDDLIGFNRLVRAPLDSSRAHAPSTLPGYRQVQQASYVRMLLPHGWELWGVDITENGVDFRQRRHLRPEGEPRPKKLIVCTQWPPIVLDTDDARPIHKTVLHELGLSSDFTQLATDPTKPLGDHLECRLDLSGDIHHYARYGAVDNRDKRTEIDQHRFAGVVSGGGGAFLHPTSFDGPIEAEKKFPTPKQCLDYLAWRLVSIANVFASGHAWLLAGLVALAIASGYAVWGPEVIAPWNARGSMIPGRHLAMGVAIVVAIALPIVWLFRVRPLLLGKRGIVKTVPEPDASAFAQQHEPPSRKKSLLSWQRDLLDRHPVVDIVWVSANIAIVFLCIIAPPYLVNRYWPEPAAGTMWGSLAVIAMLFFAVGGLLFAVLLGAPTKPRILPFAIIGLGHAFIQLALPLALIHASWTGIGITAGIWIGAGVLAVLIARFTTKRAWVAGIFVALMWFAAAALSLWVLARHHEPHAFGWGLAMVAVLVGVLVCVLQFGWYLLVGYLWGGHNNEAGAAVRCQNYKQFIRFHIGTDGVLTGYVIGIETACDPTKSPPAATLVDVFQLKPAP
ncbi:MAG: hypothetical protein AB7T06_18835 [Kofleriaceae bacterium]